MRRVALVFLIMNLLLPSIVVNAQTALAGQLIAEVNRYRADLGLAGLTNQGQLMQAAQKHANWMAATGNYSHTGEGGSTIMSRARDAGFNGYVYEIIAWGAQNYVDIGWAVFWWSNSPVHNEIMTSNNTHIGAGVATNASDYVFVVMIGTPYSNPSPDGPAEDVGPNAQPPRDDPPIIQMVPIEIAAPREDGSVVHVVQEGQTAWAIASRYGVDLDEMLALNHMDRRSYLFIGDEVLVKLGPDQTAPPAPTVPAIYQVQEGQTLWEIAVTHDMTLDELLDLNGMERGDIINPGDELRLRADGGVLVTATPPAVDEPTPTEIVFATIPAVRATDPPTTPTVAPSMTATIETATATPSNTPAATIIAQVNSTPEPRTVTSKVATSDEDDYSMLLIAVAVVGVVGMALVGVGVVLLRRE